MTIQDLTNNEVVHFYKVKDTNWELVKADNNFNHNAFYLVYKDETNLDINNPYNRFYFGLTRIMHKKPIRAQTTDSVKNECTVIIEQ